MLRSLLIALALLIAAGVIFKYAFTVREVNLEDKEACLSRDSVRNQYIGKNLLTVNAQKEEKAQKQKNSCVEGITVTRKFPGTLQISVKSKLPVAKIDGTDLLSTADGLVIKKQITANIPTIYLSNAKELKENSTITEPAAKFALEISSNLLKSDYTPASVRIMGGGDIAVYSTGGIIALFTTRKAASQQVDSLQSIMTKAKIDASKIEKLDLRFDKPTVVFK